MENKKCCPLSLSSGLGSGSLASNVVFGFVLVGMEKLVELEFECPCDPEWNRLFSSAFFVIPAVLAFTVMLLLHAQRRPPEVRCARALAASSLVPSAVWLVLLFLDGQYFACAKTHWKGRFVLVHKDAPQKWCEPTAHGTPPTPNPSPASELLQHSQQFYVLSQVIGIALLSLLCSGLIVYLLRERCHRDKTLRQGDSNLDST